MAANVSHQFDEQFELHAHFFYKNICLIIVLGKSIGNLQDIMTHIGYRGIHLHLTYSVENDRYTTMCDTYSNGSYELFSLLGSTIPK